MASNSMAATKGRVEGILFLTIMAAAAVFLVNRSGVVSSGLFNTSAGIQNLFKGAAGTGT